MDRVCLSVYAHASITFWFLSSTINKQCVSMLLETVSTIWFLLPSRMRDILYWPCCFWQFLCMFLCLGCLSSSVFKCHVPCHVNFVCMLSCCAVRVYCAAWHHVLPSQRAPRQVVYIATGQKHVLLREGMQTWCNECAGVSEVSRASIRHSSVAGVNKVCGARTAQREHSTVKLVGLTNANQPMQTKANNGKQRHASVSDANNINAQPRDMPLVRVAGSLCTGTLNPQCLCVLPIPGPSVCVCMPYVTLSVLIASRPHDRGTI